MDEKRGQHERPAGPNLQRRRTDQRSPQPAPLPWVWIAVDGLGNLLLALGAAETLGGWPLLSQIVPIADIAMIAMVAGVVLTGLAISKLVKVRRQSAN